MKTIKILVSVALLTSFTIINGQDEWNWGDQVDIAKEKNVLYTDAKKAKNYKGAIGPLDWLLENTPDLNPSIYINGVEIYKELAKKESDPAKKEEYIQKLLVLYDKRAEIYSGDRAKIVERKGIDAYSFYKKTEEQYESVFNILKEGFDLKGAKMNKGALVALMDMTYKNYLYKRLTEDDVINLYSEISEALNKQKEDAGDSEAEKLNTYIDTVDRLLAATKIEISCEMVEERFGPKLDEGKDVNIAKRIFDLMIKGKCIERPLALKAAGIIQENDPTYGVAKFLAAKYTSEENYKEAFKFYEEAASLTDDNSEKAEMYVSIAKVQSKQGLKSASRSSARRALSFDPSYTDAYTHIGDLYMGSFNDCKQEKSQVNDRLVFIAAYNEYKKAGNAADMAKAKEQFPSISDIFTEGKQEGQSVTVGCWINTTVTLERRPESK